MLSCDVMASHHTLSDGGVQQKFSGMSTANVFMGEVFHNIGKPEMSTLNKRNKLTLRCRNSRKFL